MSIQLQISSITDLQQIKKDPVIVFWLNPTEARVERVDQWSATGILIRRRDDPRDEFPRCVFDLNDEPEKTES